MSTRQHLNSTADVQVCSDNSASETKPKHALRLVLITDSSLYMICIGSKTGIRNWFGKGLEVKGLASENRQGSEIASPAARAAENAVDLASDCHLPLR